jgi:hypothetical protein
MLKEHIKEILVDVSIIISKGAPKCYGTDINPLF